MVSDKVSDLVSNKFDIGKSFGFSFVQILGILDDVLVSKLFHFLDGFGFGIENNLVSKKVSDSVSKVFGIGKSIGFGIGTIWYRKKVSDFGYRQTLV